MRRTPIRFGVPIRILFLLFMASALATAQSSSGYFFVAPGGGTCCGVTNATVHMGAGVDAVLWHGLGADLEIGALGPTQNFGDGVFGLLSLGPSYHFRKGKDYKLDPFVTGGYSLAFRNGHENLVNFGGGFTYWAAGRLGLRTEFRDHVWRGYNAMHFWGFKVGLALR